MNPTNPQGFTPETSAGFTNLEQTAGFFLNVSGYIGSANGGIGNVRTFKKHALELSRGYLGAL